MIKACKAARSPFSDMIIFLERRYSQPKSYGANSIHRTTVRSEINAAIATFVPVITMDSDAPVSKRLFFYRNERL